MKKDSSDPGQTLWPSPPGDPFGSALNEAAYLSHLGVHAARDSAESLISAAAGAEKIHDFRQSVLLRYKAAMAYLRDRDTVRASESLNNWYRIGHFELTQGKLDRSIAADALVIGTALEISADSSVILRSLARASITLNLKGESKRAERLLKIADIYASNVAGSPGTAQEALSAHLGARGIMACATDFPHPVPVPQESIADVAHQLLLLTISFQAAPEADATFMFRVGDRAADMLESCGKLHEAGLSSLFTAEGLRKKREWALAHKSALRSLELYRSINESEWGVRIFLTLASVSMRRRDLYENAVSPLRAAQPSTAYDLAQLAFVECAAAMLIDKDPRRSARVADGYMFSVQRMAGYEGADDLDLSTEGSRDVVAHHLAFLFYARIFLDGAPELHRNRDAFAAAQIHIRLLANARSRGDSKRAKIAKDNIKHVLQAYSLATYSGASVLVLRDLIVDDIKGNIEEAIVMEFWEIAIEAAKGAANLSVSAVDLSVSLFEGWQL